LYFIGSSSISVCHFYATFGVSQAKSDRRDRLKIGGQAAIAIGGDESFAG